MVIQSMTNTSTLDTAASAIRDSHATAETRSFLADSLQIGGLPHPLGGKAHETGVRLSPSFHCVRRGNARCVSE